MLNLTYAPNDETLARRILTDLRAAGYPVEEIRSSSVQSRQDILIAVLSSEANANTVVQDSLLAALDNGQHIIPVLAQSVEIPKLIDHLNVLDFSTAYDFSMLRQAVEQAQSPDASLPLRVRTPAVKRTNRRVGVVLGLLALVWFVVGIYAVGVLRIQAPQEEYNAVDTAAAATQAYFINPELDRYGAFLPRSSEEAVNYEPTLGMVPTVYRPFMAATATAYGMGTPLATNDMRTATPVPASPG